MLSKFLEKKLEVSTKDGEINLEKPMQLEYFLLESEVKDRGELHGKKVYGIEVVKNDGKGCYETEMVKDLFNCRESTKALLDKLADNMVTPVSLFYILDDLIGA